MKIHPTAIVDPAAEIHETAEIGPFSIIEGDVVIGEGSVIMGGGRIFSGTRIGKFNEIHHGAVLGGVPQHLTFDQSIKTELIIGDNNVLREYCNLHRASKPETPTRVGNHNYLMGNCHMGHDCVIGDHNILTQSCGLAGHVVVGNWVFISAFAGVHQFCRIGDYAMVGGLAKVTHDIPPYVMVSGHPAEINGLNAVGLRRSSLTEQERREIKNAFKALFRSGNPIKTSIARLRDQNPPEVVQKLLRFIEESERGIMHYRKIVEE